MPLQYIGPNPSTARDVTTKTYVDDVSVTSTTIDVIVTITQAAYDALSPPNANTLYVIIP